MLYNQSLLLPFAFLLLPYNYVVFSFVNRYLFCVVFFSVGGLRAGRQSILPGR